MKTSPSPVAPEAAHEPLTFFPPDGIIVPVPPLPAALQGVLLRTTPDLGAGLLRDDKRKVRFAVFSSDFINLQLSMVRALSLPISIGDFDKKYGTFASKGKVVACVEALKELSAHCAKFGNPAKLVSEIQTLAAGTKPDTLYGQIVWLAQHIANMASTVSYTIAEIESQLKRSASKQERYEILREMLIGEGGLMTEAKMMETRTKELQNSILAFTERLREIKQPIDIYFSEKSDIYKEAQDRNKDISAKLVQAQAELVSVRADYVNYVIAASTTSVGLFVFSWGILWPLSAVAGGVLGDLAEKARKRANELEAYVGTLSGEVQQKVQLVSDVNSLNTALTPVESYLTKVSDTLGVIAGVWGNAAFTFHSIATDTTPDSLKDMSVFNQRFRISDAQRKWQETADATGDFTVNAFVEVQNAPAA